MTRKIGALLLALVVSTVLVMPSFAANTNKSGGLLLPVTGNFSPSATPGPLSSLGTGTLTGTLNVQRFAVQDGALVAIGTLTATLRDAAGNVIQTIVTQVVIPVVNPSGSCQILHLELGPLDLDLLGLVVHLDKVVLDITAQAGAGNLLGNLLCAIANLLNGGPLNALAQLLNQLLGLLG